MRCEMLVLAVYTLCWCLGSMSNLAHSVSDATLSGLSAATATISKANARKAPVDTSNIGTHMIDVSHALLLALLP